MGAAVNVMDDAGFVSGAKVVEVATDRCDAKDCNAQAYVYARLTTGTLSFCGHHGTEYWAGLASVAVVLIDQRDQIPS